LSLSQRGLHSSLGLGGRGANINLSPRGTRTTVGVPGTGLSYVKDRRAGQVKRPEPAQEVLPPPPPTPEENDASGWGWAAGAVFLFAVVVIIAFLAR
ncbi:DUF4236 domain-containing protein, partial [Teichococcus wenyumeiae]